MILLFYGFDYIVGRSKDIGGLNGQRRVVAEKSCEWEKLEPKGLLYCVSHIQAMRNQKKQCHDWHPVTFSS